MHKIILILSLFICNFAFSQSYIIPIYPVQGDTIFSKKTDTIRNFASKQIINIGTGITIGNMIDGTSQYQRGDGTFGSFYHKDSIIYPDQPLILSAIEIKKGIVKLHLSDPRSDTITIYRLENYNVDIVKYKLLKF